MRAERLAYLKNRPALLRQVDAHLRSGRLVASLSPELKAAYWDFQHERQFGAEAHDITEVMNTETYLAHVGK